MIFQGPFQPLQFRDSVIQWINDTLINSYGFLNSFLQLPPPELQTPQVIIRTLAQAPDPALAPAVGSAAYKNTSSFLGVWVPLFTGASCCWCRFCVRPHHFMQSADPQAAEEAQGHMHLLKLWVSTCRTPYSQECQVNACPWHPTLLIDAPTWQSCQGLSCLSLNH